MVCPKCHNDLSIYVMGEAVLISKKRSDNPMERAAKKRLMAYQRVLLQKETEQMELIEKS